MSGEDKILGEEPGPNAYGRRYVRCCLCGLLRPGDCLEIVTRGDTKDAACKDHEMCGKWARAGEGQ